MKTLNEIYNELANTYGDKHGEMVFTFSDKGAMHSYIDFYESYFVKKRDHVRLLEIGMMTGGSMHMWQQYFQDYDLTGLDLAQTWNQPRPFQAAVESDARIRLLFGVNSTQGIPDSIIGQQYDFIIDDGDHSVQAQIKTFLNYYPSLAPGGTYFIEDVVGEDELNTLRKFVLSYREEQFQDFTIRHYGGFKNGRRDDQILAITRHK